MNTDYYILRTNSERLKILTINNSESKNITIQDLLKVKNNESTFFNDSLQVLITPTQIVIATAQKYHIGCCEDVEDCIYIHLIKVPIL
jgi:hypothetical protein